MKSNYKSMMIRIFLILAFFLMAILGYVVCDKLKVSNHSNELIMESIDEEELNSFLKKFFCFVRPEKLSELKDNDIFYKIMGLMIKNNEVIRLPNGYEFLFLDKIIYNYTTYYFNKPKIKFGEKPLTGLDFKYDSAQKGYISVIEFEIGKIEEDVFDYEEKYEIKELQRLDNDTMEKCE